MANPKRSKLVGRKFGRLTVIKDAGNDKRGTSLWECKCDCGNIKIVRYNHLVPERIKSCGCFRREIGRLEIGESGLNKLFKGYIRNSNSKSIEFSLIKEEFKILTKQNCHYCGVDPQQKINGNSKKSSEESINWGEYTYNGIDRKDNNNGYTIENCVPCCKICNMAKRSMSFEYFNDWIKRIVTYNSKILEKI